jgi:hypothetical protein
MSGDSKDARGLDPTMRLGSDAFSRESPGEDLDAELSALADGELDPRRAGELEREIQASPLLASRLEAFRQLDRSLSQLSAPELPADFAARTRARMIADAATPDAVPTVHRLHESAGRFGPRTAVAALAAMAAGLVLLLQLAPEPTTPSPEVAELEDWERYEAELGDASDEDIAIALEIDTLSDLDVIRELDLLEALAEASERVGAS